MIEQQIKTTDSACPSCGATMKYAPHKQKLFCENCETCKDINFVKLTNKRPWEQRDKATKSTQDWAKKAKILKCSNCGANVELNKLEYTKKCPYCETSLVGEGEILDEIQPDGIIPFKFSKQQVSENFINGVKKKFFVPKAFKKAIPTENIDGVYVPSFTFDAKTFSVYKGVLEKEHTRKNSRGESETYTTTKHISGEHDANLQNIAVESSTVLNQAQFADILPFDMVDLVEFKQGFIMGYTVEQYESTVDNCMVIAKRIMEEQIKRQILSKYSYDSVRSFDMTTTYSEQKYLYNLLPVYKCNFTYKNKNYTTFMNGQTGKVGGGFPISVWKVLLVVLLVMGGIGLFIALILMTQM